MIGRMGGSLLNSKKSLHSQMTSQFAQHQEDLEFRLLRVLQDKPDVSQRELASQLGISHGKMNYCLNALIEKGLVKLDNFQNSQHKFKYAYLLTPAGIAEKAKLTSPLCQNELLHLPVLV